MAHPAVGVALLGYGYAGRTFHAPLIGATPGLALAAVMSRRADEVRADLPAARVHAALAPILTDPAIELVVIATPNTSHAPLAEAALTAGKHVVVDKPFALSLADARRLAALAQARRKLLAVFQNRRWDADFLGLRAALREGRVGVPSHFESRFDRFRPVPQHRWREKAADGGGIWFDLGPHLVDQALQLFGLPQRVGASLRRMRDGAEADDWCQVQLDYGLLQVSLSASVLVGGGVPRFALHGSRGSWISHGLDVQESQLLAGLRPGSPGWGRAPAAAGFHDGAAVVASPLPDGDYGAFFRAVRDAIRGGSANPVPPGQAVATMAVLEIAVEADRQGRMLPLPLTTDERHAFGAPSIDATCAC